MNDQLYNVSQTKNMIYFRISFDVQNFQQNFHANAHFFVVRNVVTN